MSFNARRRCIKIVNQPLDKQAEISGGIKNALERGSSLAKAKQSFLNAGYKSEEVQAAVNSMGRVSMPNIQPLPNQQSQQQIIQQPSKTNQQFLQQPVQHSKQKKHLSKTFIIISVILTIIILGAAAFLGIYWDKLF